MSLITAGLLASVVFGLAAAAQAVSRFGMALVAVPLLALVVGPAPAVAATTVVALVLTTGATVLERAHVEWRIAARLAAAGLLGMPLGYLVLSRVAERPLRLAIAVVLLVLVGRPGHRGAGARGRAGQWGAGALGVLLTSTGMNGPPLVVLLHSRRLDPRRFRGTLQATFCARASPRWRSSPRPVWSDPRRGAGGRRGPGGAAGLVGGEPAVRWLPPERFRVVVLGMLAALAVASLVAVAVG